LLGSIPDYVKGFLGVALKLNQYTRNYKAQNNSKLRLNNHMYNQGHIIIVGYKLSRLIDLLF